MQEDDTDGPPSPAPLPGLLPPHSHRRCASRHLCCRIGDAGRAGKACCEETGGHADTRMSQAEGPSSVSRGGTPLSPTASAQTAPPSHYQPLLHPLFTERSQKADRKAPYSSRLRVLILPCEVLFFTAKQLSTLLPNTVSFL